MKKNTKSLETANAKSKSYANLLIKSPSHSALPASLASKVQTIKKKISEILTQKAKTLKNLSNLKKRFRLSIKKEKSLEILSNTIGTRIKNLEKRKILLKLLKKERKFDKELLLYYKKLIERFKYLAVNERKVEDAEQELNLKDPDLSFDSRSSDSTQTGSLVKESMQITLLKSTISKIGEKEESLFRHSNIAKYKKDAIFGLREKFENEQKNFEVQLEAFFQLQIKFDEFKKKVLREKEKTEKLVKRNQIIFEEVEIISVKNDGIFMEIKELKNKFFRSWVDLKAFKVKIEEKEEKVAILKESLEFRQFRVEAFKEKVEELQKVVCARVEYVKKKEELNQVLVEIDKEVKSDSPKFNLEGRRKRISELVHNALEKEKELRKVEKLVNN
jgi:hypothetical protein